ARRVAEHSQHRVENKGCDVDYVTVGAVPAIKSRRAPTKGDQREQSLIDAARVVFRDKSISQVTIDELAGAAGIARSGFYFYFESKQALLAVLVDQRLA